MATTTFEDGVAADSNRMRKDTIDAYVKENKKSRVAMFALTVLFGPLGLAYTSPGLAFLYCVICGSALALGITGAIFSGVAFAPFFILWAVVIGIGDHSVYNYNKKLRAQATLAQMR